MLDDVDSMIIECELYRIGGTMHWQGDCATAAEPASSCRPIRPEVTRLVARLFSDQAKPAAPA
jgi:hypothetical protein